MIFLSNSALKYAVDICQEKEKYRVGIASMNADKLDTMRELLPALITDRSCVEAIINSKSEFKIYFKNGSSITLISAASNIRGKRIHLLIADKEIPIDIMRIALMPCETAAWMEYTHEQGVGFKE